jgi:hypothetical protein
MRILLGGLVAALLSVVPVAQPAPPALQIIEGTVRTRQIELGYSESGGGVRRTMPAVDRRRIRIRVASNDNSA